MSDPSKALGSHKLSVVVANVLTMPNKQSIFSKECSTWKCCPKISNVKGAMHLRSSIKNPCDHVLPCAEIGQHTWRFMTFRKQKEGYLEAKIWARGGRQNSNTTTIDRRYAAKTSSTSKGSVGLTPRFSPHRWAKHPRQLDTRSWKVREATAEATTASQPHWDWAKIFALLTTLHLEEASL